MTIAAGKTPYHTYFPGSAMSSEAIPFEYLDGADISVSIVGGAALVEGVHYQLGGDGRTGAGTITALIDAGSAEWELWSETPTQQQINLAESRKVPLPQYERELDRAAIRTREITFNIDRAPKVPRGEVPPGIDLAGLVDGELLRVRDGKIQRLDGSPFAGRFYAGRAGDGLPVPAEGSGGGDDALRGDMADPDAGMALLATKRDATGAAPQNAKVVLERTLDARDFQYAPDRTPSQNKQAIKDVIDAAAPGERIWFPEFLCPLEHGVLSEAPLIDKRLTLIGLNVQSDFVPTNTSADIHVDPRTLLHVSAAGSNVSFERCRLIGQNGWNDLNEGVAQTMPTFLYWEGDHGKLTGVFDSAPKCAITVVGCEDGDFDALILGGPDEYEDGHTGHFGYRVEGGGGHVFRGRQKEGGVTGGRTTQVVWSSGGAKALTIEMKSARPWEKLAYLYGDEMEILGGWVEDALITDVVRIVGSHGRLKGLRGRNCKGVAQIWNAHDTLVDGVDFEGLLQVAVQFRHDDGWNTANDGPLDRNKVLRSRFAADLASGIRGEGVRFFYPGTGNASECEVSHCEITGFAPNAGQGLVSFDTAGTNFAYYRPKANDNILSNANTAIIFRRALYDTADDNKVFSLASWPIVRSDSAYGNFHDNKGLSGGVPGSPGISGIGSTDSVSGNQWTNDKLEFAVTIPNGSSSGDVTRTGVSSYAIGQPEPTNQAAANAVVVSGLPRVSIVGQVVTVSQENNAASDQTYLVTLRQ
ncbi:MAG: hypothetical protein ABJF09_00460 [Qipengyuania citrea]|uniref:hypothetical protein n=1 Tax=Qipengyuania citrea TaxID=225971 RepID=UPI003263877A